MPDAPLPGHLTDALATTYRRLAELIETGTHDATPMPVIVHTDELSDRDLRHAVEEIARHGHRVAVNLEIRGTDPHPSQFRLDGSTVILSAIVTGNATYVPTPRAWIRK